MSYMNPTAFPAMLELLTSPPHEIDMLLEDSWGRTALHVAAEYGNDVAVETLLDRGADKLAEDHKAKTAYQYAADAVAGTYTLRVMDDVDNVYKQKKAYERIEEMLLLNKSM
eukprot:TRINITY_DN1413_c0_g1_i5.p2 TRINITY_DN1413_c0_g1~~TRINITY_DN1413_c0_g1_i5.p2  ORF type:complete len:112 (-),score=33.27 TRINITY_DN1413_c0_g1_i5:317-652(-)